MSTAMLPRSVALAAVLSSAACSSLQPPAPAASTQPGSGRCNADAVQWAVGKEGSQENLGRVWRESGAGLIRPIGPKQAVTMDYRPDRVNVSLDEANVVTKVSCG